MKQFLSNELINSAFWMKRAIDRKDVDWSASPNGFKTNINWQVGHIIISSYFHTVISINGSDEKIKSEMNPKAYSAFYGMGSNPMAQLDIKPSKEILLSNLELIDQRALEILDGMTEDDLMAPTVIANNMAKNKMEALVWATKHKMWHAGQIALIQSHFR